MCVCVCVWVLVSIRHQVHTAYRQAHGIVDAGPLSLADKDAQECDDDNVDEFDVVAQRKGRTQWAIEGLCDRDSTCLPKRHNKSLPSV